MWVKKAHVVRTVNIAMIALLVLLMAYTPLTEKLHECLGVTMFVLVAIHIFINRRWYTSIFSGSYTPYRILLTTVDLIVLADLALLFYSGVNLSAHVFSLLPSLGSSSVSRILHLSGSHWGMLLLSFHWGLHLVKLRYVAEKYLIVKPIMLLVVLYGINVLVKRNIGAYLFPSSLFIFFDSGESLVSLITDYIFVMVSAVYAGAAAAQITKKKRRKKNGVCNIK